MNVVPLEARGVRGDSMPPKQAAEPAPESSTVAFNLALLLSKVGLVETAREQWRRCLARALGVVVGKHQVERVALLARFRQ